MNTLRLFAIAFMLMFSVNQFTEAKVIYTWVDDNGVSHYSEQAPVGVNATRIYSEDIEPGKMGFIAPKANKETVQEQTELEKNAALIKAQDVEQAEMLCERAKHSLEILTTYSKLNKKDEKTGETVAMTEEDRQAETKMNQERVRLFCN